MPLPAPPVAPSVLEDLPRSRGVQGGWTDAGARLSAVVSVGAVGREGAGRPASRVLGWVGGGPPGLTAHHWVPEGFQDARETGLQRAWAAAPPGGPTAGAQPGVRAHRSGARTEGDRAGQAGS